MEQAATKEAALSAPAPLCPVGFAACARVHAIEIIATLLLFFSASLSAGRVWRFPFDDEIYTLKLIERQTALSLLTTFPRSEDEHPPLGYLVFYGLHQLGLSDAGMRLCCLVMTAVTLALFQLLAFSWIAQHKRSDNAFPIRLIAVLLFSLTPLAIGQGDALRWFPPFALLVSLFVTFYFAASGPLQLWSGAALGLAGSVDLTAALLVPPFMFYRYVLQRRFQWSFDVTYWLLTAAGASLGFYSAVWMFTNRLAHVRGNFGNGIIRSVLTDVLGFFGGNSLGVGQAWIVLPAAVIFVVAAAGEINRQKPDKPVHFLLLLFSVPALMALAGFGAPRSFLWLAPTVPVLLTMFFDRQIRQCSPGRVLVLLSLVFATSISAVANVNFGAHPFKRNSAIPYQSILDFIHDNGSEHALVISTDPVLLYLLGNMKNGSCDGYLLEAARCLSSGGRYDSVFVISGHGNRSGNPAVMEKFNTLVSEATAGRTKAATLHAGVDEDAALKTRLTGVPLDGTILKVEYYR